MFIFPKISIPVLLLLPILQWKHYIWLNIESKIANIFHFSVNQHSIDTPIKTNGTICLELWIKLWWLFSLFRVFDIALKHTYNNRKKNNSYTFQFAYSPNTKWMIFLVIGVFRSSITSSTVLSSWSRSSKFTLESNKYFTTSFLPHNAASCRAVPRAVRTLMSNPRPSINSTTSLKQLVLISLVLDMMEIWALMLVEYHLIKR